MFQYAPKRLNLLLMKALNGLRDFRVNPDEISFVGHDLQRPECILADPNGSRAGHRILFSLAGAGFTHGALAHGHH